MIKKFKERSKPTNLYSLEKNLSESVPFSSLLLTTLRWCWQPSPRTWDFKLSPPLFYSISSLESSNLRPPRSIGFAKVCCLRGCRRAQ